MSLGALVPERAFGPGEGGGPALARRLAGAGRIEFGSEFSGIRQLRIGLAVDRHRIVDVLGEGVSIEGGLGIGAERLALLGEAFEAAACRRIADRKESAVAGPDADGFRAAARDVVLRCGGGGSDRPAEARPAGAAAGPRTGYRKSRAAVAGRRGNRR